MMVTTSLRSAGTGTQGYKTMVLCVSGLADSDGNVAFSETRKLDYALCVSELAASDVIAAFRASRKLDYAGQQEVAH